MKTVLITGASSGIGKATAQLFADKGWNVIATMRRPAGEAAGNMLITRLDVEDRASIDAAVAEAIARFGVIDVLVNNAGYGQFGLFEAVPREKAMEQFDVNLFGVMDVTRAVLPHMRARKQGAIINVSSGAGLYTLPMTSLYCASKFALEGFSEALSYELGALGIMVKLVIPHGGVSATDFSRRAAEDGVKPLPEYDAFVAEVADATARMPAPRSIASGDVAKVIFAAATDDTDRLRYLVGDDARGFIKAWETMKDEDYVAFMRGHFKA